MPSGTGGPGAVPLQRVSLLDDAGEGGEADGGGETDSRQRALSGEREGIGRQGEQSGEIGRVTAEALQVKVPGMKISDVIQV